MAINTFLVINLESNCLQNPQQHVTTTRNPFFPYKEQKTFEAMNNFCAWNYSTKKNITITSFDHTYLTITQKGVEIDKNIKWRVKGRARKPQRLQAWILPTSFLVASSRCRNAPFTIKTLISMYNSLVMTQKNLVIFK